MRAREQPEGPDPRDEVRNLTGCRFDPLKQSRPAAQPDCFKYYKWCRWPESNRHAVKHYPLKIACLPIPPHRLYIFTLTEEDQIVLAQDLQQDLQPKEVNLGLPGQPGSLPESLTQRAAASQQWSQPNW